MFGQASALSMLYFSKEKLENINLVKAIKGSIEIITISSIIFGSIGYFIWLVYYDQEIKFIICLLVIFCSYFTAIQTTLNSLLMCMDKYRINLLLSVIFSSVIITPLLILPGTITYIISVMVGAILVIIFAFSGAGIKINRKIESGNKKNELIKLGWIAVPGMLISSGGGFIERLMLNYYLDIKQVAIYSIAILVSVNMGKILVLGLIKPNYIMLLENLQNDKIIAFKIKLNQMENLFIYLCLVAVTLNYLFSDKLMKIIFGEQFVEANLIMIVLFIGVMLDGMMQFIAHILIQDKKE
jgi:O-antigen/teichoic acid export membrane protein